MFDWIKEKLYCPFCGFRQGGFQTKSFDKILNILSIKNMKDQNYEIHAICEKCDHYISINIDKFTSGKFRKIKRKVKDLKTR